MVNINNTVTIRIDRKYSNMIRNFLNHDLLANSKEKIVFKDIPYMLAFNIVLKVPVEVFKDSDWIIAGNVNRFEEVINSVNKIIETEVVIDNIEEKESFEDDYKIEQVEVETEDIHEESEISKKVDFRNNKYNNYKNKK